MKRTKIGKAARIPSPFDTSAYKTERSAVAVLMHWMREIIEQQNLDLGLPDVDTSGADRKSPDTVIYESRRSQNVLCVIEAKPPYFDVFDEPELKRPAWEKANRRSARYFATTNFRDLIWFNTENVNALRPLEEQIIDKYHLSTLENLEQLEVTRYKESTIRQLEAFLAKLYVVARGKEPEPKQAIDELLIYRLQTKIGRLSNYYTEVIQDRCHKDTDFSSKLGKWFREQGWSFAWQPQDFDKAARQTAYLLVNKILFYNLLQAKRPQELDPLEIPQSLTKGALLQATLQGYFNQVLKIDYETIYTTDFIDAIAFHEEDEVVREVKELVNILHQYDFSKLGYDIIGNIFQRLIPEDERHNLGQYFTNADIVDIILKFCLRHENDKVLDPACGAGTFLVRAYQHKMLMNQFLSHDVLLDTLWGNDIAKFPAHLATINLAINDLGTDKNYPNILQEDFFTLLSTDTGFDMPQRWRKARARTLGLGERNIEYPHWFDCIVGNPPYTRQEEISEIAPQVAQYKGGIIEKALKDTTGREIANIPRRAGIHAYFFVHGTKFLRNGGRFGFIVSNSWLDVDYGKGLQEFFLRNYRIITIIESKVERWFEDADINTCIIILEKCSGDKESRERSSNLTRFVYLKKPLRYFIPPAQDMWQKQVERLNSIDKFIKTISAPSEFYENEDLRIFPKLQAELWEEGFDREQNKYIGSKWGKYIRAPEIFFKILEKGRGKLVPLKQIAKVKRGFTTGADPWFYVEDLTNSLDQEQFQKITGRKLKQIRRQGLKLIESGDGSRWLIESKYLLPITRNPDDFPGIRIQETDVKTKVVMISIPGESLKDRYVKAYIRHGEAKLYNMGKGRKMIPARTQTCSSRKYWYQLPDFQPSRLLWQKAIDRYHRHYYCDTPILANQRFYNISPTSPDDEILIACCLNSSFTALYLEFQRAAMGLGAIEATVNEVSQMLVLDSKHVSESIKEGLTMAFTSLCKGPVKPVFEEVKDIDRLDLDRFLLEAIGFEGKERDETLSALHQELTILAKARLGKAKSFGKRRKTREGLDIELFIKTVMDKVGEGTLGKFYQEKILSHKPLVTKRLPQATGEVRIEPELFGWRLSWGRQHLDCTSEHEARYLKVWLEVGLDSVKMPKDEDYLEEVVLPLEELRERISKTFEIYLSSIINAKVQHRLSHQLWQQVVK